MPNAPLAVRLGERSYAIHVELSYARLPARLSSLKLPQDAWIVSHPRLLAQHGAALMDPLHKAGWRLHTIGLPESEATKSFAMAQRLIRRLARGSAMRVPLLIAFGGGVIGDLTGFVAAVFRRGVPYVQAPTTLLAQVDSAIGGKTGIDLAEGKNLVGAYYQPKLVWNNTNLLATLPMRQRRSGLAEVIKYGVIADAALFGFLERAPDDCLALEAGAVERMVRSSCGIKAAVVSRDEQERLGPRLWLNFGHTIGHALETVTRYRRWTHGEAIAIGMCAAARLATEVTGFPSRDAERLEALLRRYGLPVRAQGVSARQVFSTLRYDKKFIHGRPRWVLPSRLGRVVITEAVPEALVRRILKRYAGG